MFSSHIFKDKVIFPIRIKKIYNVIQNVYHLGINKLTQNFAHLIRKVYSEYIVAYEGDGNPLQNSCLGNPWTEKPGSQNGFHTSQLLSEEISFLGATKGLFLRIAKKYFSLYRFCAECMYVCQYVHSETA